MFYMKVTRWASRHNNTNEEKGFKEKGQKFRNIFTWYCFLSRTTRHWKF